MHAKRLSAKENQLGAFFETMHSLLLQQTSIASQGALPSLPAHRLRIYQQSIAERTQRCLEPIYTSFPHLLGKEAWQDCLAEFERIYPLREVDPNDYAQHFVSFLSNHRPQYPWLSQLASLEWHEFAVATAPLVTIPAMRLQWSSHPTLLLVETTYPVTQWLLAWRRGSPASISLQTTHPEMALLFAHKPGHYTTKLASPGELLCLHWLNSGCTLEELAKAAQCSVAHLVAARVEAQKIGLLLPPTTPIS